MVACAHFSFQFQDSVLCRLRQNLCALPQSPKFICTLICWVQKASLVSSIPSGSQALFTCSSAEFHEPTSHLELSIPKSLTLCISSVCGYQLGITSGLGMRVCVHFPSQCLDPSLSDLCRLHACYHHLYEFIGVTLLLYLEGLVSLVSSITSWLLPSLCFLFHRGP